MWFITDAAPEASLYVGLKQGVTRAEFERKIADGSVADCFHRLPVHAGDTMFLPSGRVHAIGDGLVIFEIQQNSDTTYRVFDWNRVGLDGKPRELHIQQSLESIDFNDFEPKLAPAQYADNGNHRVRHLVRDPLFAVDEIQAKTAGVIGFGKPALRIIAVVQGTVTMVGGDSLISVQLKAGQFGLIPAGVTNAEIRATAQTTFLSVEGH
jgi:mannose-6-phosphate isomerase